MGSPAKVKRNLTVEELNSVTDNADIYVAFKKKNEEELWDTPIQELVADVKKSR
jgi:carbonic anhydrase/acetyltransferase-like protein (isoleucine patch superfamily)